jgi:hypothetical protein
MKRVLSMTAASVLVLLIVVYVADYAVLRLRGAARYDTIQVDVIDQIPQKGNKAEYIPEGRQPQTCVRSLFPHDGNQPCWYLRRHTTQQVNF